MAEGGTSSRTLEDGSKALFYQECTECRAHGSTQEATDFCQDCKQLLCKICRILHVRYMKTHSLLSIPSMTKSNTALLTASPTPVTAKCHLHPGRDIEMYCGTHDMVYCSLCVAKEHRSCVNVQEIKEVANTSKLFTLQTLVEEITRVNKMLHDTKQEKSNDLKHMKKMKANLLQEINAVRKKMNTHLDALEQNIITELDAEQNKWEKEINADIMVADDLITSSDQRKPDLTSDYDEKQMFINEKLSRVVLAEANSFIKSANLSKCPLLKFVQNDAICDAIEKSECMGKITRIESKSKRSNYTVKCNKEINVRVNSDNSTCFINDIRQLPDGSIIMIDHWNKKLKRLDDQLNVKDFLDVKAKPMGLCSVSPTEVAVRMKDKTIDFISIGKYLSYQRSVHVNHKNVERYGMACCNNQLWIPGDGAVYVYSLSGTLVKKIETDSQGRKIFPSFNPKHIAVSDDALKVYVAAYEVVVVFNSSGDVIKELRDQRLDGASGLCITEDDIVLVAGYNSKNVVMFGRDGNCLDELVSSNNMLSAPWSLCYDRKRCRLLAGYGADKVQIFQLTGL